MKTIDPKKVSTAQLHGCLLGSIAPRPIAFASTIDSKGQVNLSPFSFFNVFSASPPILIFSPARRVRDNTTKDTFENACDTKQVVINVVNYDIVQQMSLSSTEYPKGVNEFIKSGLTMQQSQRVKPFRVKESPVQFECTVNQVITLGEKPGAGNLILCQVELIHICDNVLNSKGIIDPFAIDLVARMGGDYYSRSKEGIFKVTKPLSKLAIGIDKLPDSIKNSFILTGNDLGMLANVASLPTREEIVEFLNNNSEFKCLDITKKHKFAKEFLGKGQVDTALKILLS